MLPGEAPGRGAPGLAAPGRGAGGRGIGRSTGCADENGLLPTRGGRTPGLGIGPGRGPGVIPGAGAGCPGAGAPGGGADGRPGTGPGRAGGAGATEVTTAPSASAALAVASPLPAAFPIAWSRAVSSDRSAPFATALCGACAEAVPDAVFAAFAEVSVAGLPPPKDSRSRRATGASTVDDADLTNSPCSFSRASTSLLVTPSSFANSCTRALPATTSPVYEATVVGRASGISCNALRWGSSGLHGVLMFFATCSVAGKTGPA
jgi:hypothetical protein